MFNGENLLSLSNKLAVILFLYYIIGWISQRKSTIYYAASLETIVTDIVLVTLVLMASTVPRTRKQSCTNTTQTISNAGYTSYPLMDTTLIFMTLYGSC